MKINCDLCHQEVQVWHNYLNDDNIKQATFLNGNCDCDRGKKHIACVDCLRTDTCPYCEVEVPEHLSLAYEFPATGRSKGVSCWERTRQQEFRKTIINCLMSSCTGCNHCPKISVAAAKEKRINNVVKYVELLAGIILSDDEIEVAKNSSDYTDVIKQSLLKNGFINK
jgi:hypothetical protein